MKWWGIWGAAKKVIFTGAQKSHMDVRRRFSCGLPFCLGGEAVSYLLTVVSSPACAWLSLVTPICRTAPFKVRQHLTSIWHGLMEYLTQIFPIKTKGICVCPWYTDGGFDCVSTLKLWGDALMPLFNIYSHVLNCLNLLLHIKMQWEK